MQHHVDELCYIIDAYSSIVIHIGIVQINLNIA